MSRRDVIFSAASRRDLSQVIAEIGRNAGPKTATRWRHEFHRRASLLVERPFIGAEDDDLGPGRRRLILTPYLIVYRVTSLQRVDILRIIHGARDLPALFDADSRD